MLRLTDIKLPLNHQPEELKQTVLDKLQIIDEQLVNFSVFKRGYDARRKNSIILMYTLEVETTINDELLEKFCDDNHVKQSPDIRYHFVAQAPKTL